MIFPFSASPILQKESRQERETQKPSKFSHPMNPPYSLSWHIHPIQRIFDYIYKRLYNIEIIEEASRERRAEGGKAENKKKSITVSARKIPKRELKAPTALFPSPTLKFYEFQLEKSHKGN